MSSFLMRSKPVSISPVRPGTSVNVGMADINCSERNKKISSDSIPTSPSRGSGASSPKPGKPSSDELSQGTSPTVRRHNNRLNGINPINFEMSFLDNLGLSKDKPEQSLEYLEFEMWRDKAVIESKEDNLTCCRNLSALKPKLPLLPFGVTQEKQEKVESEVSLDEEEIANYHIQQKRETSFSNLSLVMN